MTVSSLCMFSTLVCGVNPKVLFKAQKAIFRHGQVKKSFLHFWLKEVLAINFRSRNSKSQHQPESPTRCHNFPPENFFPVQKFRPVERGVGWWQSQFSRSQSHIIRGPNSGEGMPGMRRPLMISKTRESETERTVGPGNRDADRSAETRSDYARKPHNLWQSVVSGMSRVHQFNLNCVLMVCLI